MKLFQAFINFLTISAVISDDEENKTAPLEAKGDKVLSRKKRYLIFPEGSSLQLVYCLTMPITGKSTIFTIGGTAALAWELPHDPFQPYRKPAEILHRVDDKKPLFVKKPTAYFSSPQKNALFLSPAYKYHQFINNEKGQLNLGQYFGKLQQKSDIFYRNAAPKLSSAQFGDTRFDNTHSSWYEDENDYDPIYHQVHRRTRRDLYKKIEKFITAQNKDGRTCVLKAICESRQRKREKGSFMEEIFKAIFKVKPFDTHPNEDEYDLAANSAHNCTELYPNCSSSITQFIM